MERVTIQKAKEEHIDGMEKIHLKYFSEIGEKVGVIKESFNLSGKLSFVALDSKSNIIGYIISSTTGTQNYFEWFGVLEKKKGIAQALFQEYIKKLQTQNVKESVLFTRNRFKDAIIFYIKSGYDILGLSQGRDGDLMIQLRKSI